MKKSLTHQQRRILNIIKDLTLELGKPPTLEEIRKASGLNYISSVQRHVEALKEKEYLNHVPNQSRSLSPSFSNNQKVNIPLIGNIAAGTPILAIENIEAYIPYEPSKYKFKSEDYFFLRAMGDSMNQSSIQGKTIDDGDFILVRKQNVAEPGEIIVALLGDEATVKKLTQGSDCYILKPQSSNSNNKPIYVFDDLTIQGIVVDVIKKGVMKDE